jgi:enoyl-[acyl-carrier-protein] reductase (NADH)
MRCRGTEDAVPQHEMTSPLQETFESIVRYLAVELEPWGLRVHAVSPGPALVRVASKCREGLAVPDEIDNCVAILIGAGAINVNHGTPHANTRMAALQ